MKKLLTLGHQPTIIKTKGQMPIKELTDPI